MSQLRIDIVSDVVCPWCYIGYKRLQQAMNTLADEMTFEIAWHPFELNPDMVPEGEPIDEHIQRKYGMPPEQAAENRERLSAVGKSLGIDFHPSGDRRIYNTFDAHKVLQWAREQGRDTDFSLALFEAHFEQGKNPSDPAVLQAVARSLDMPSDEIPEVLTSERYASAVREEAQTYRQAGIQAVPAYIINNSYLISGGQEPATFVQAFKQIAAGEAS